MDQSRFDAWTRALATPRRSRRQLVGTVAAVLAGATLSGWSGETAAKKKHKKKKKKPQQVLSCVPACVGRVCGDDGCGGSCGICTGLTACTNGQCVSTCVPTTCAYFTAMDLCGVRANGCGGVTEECGCPPGKACCGDIC